MNVACPNNSTAEALAMRVRAALDDERVVISARVPNAHAATFASDILHCCWPDGTERRLFCKQGGRHPDNPTGEQGGVAYEARVYHQVLSPSGLAPLRFWGAHDDPSSGTTCLAIDHLDGAVHCDRTADLHRSMGAAAGWIGSFHASAARQVGDGSASFLTRYGRSHYLPWADRFVRLAAEHRRLEPWMEAAAQRYARWVDLLIERPVTVIHGDYYPDNTLVWNDRIYPIDWGWTAIGPGEIDLASFTEGWPDDLRRACRDQYVTGRWSGHAEPSFDAALSAARLYLLFRWLGHRSDWVGNRKWERRLRNLRALSEQLGLM